MFLFSDGGSALFELSIDCAITLDNLQAIDLALVGERRSDFRNECLAAVPVGAPLLH